MSLRSVELYGLILLWYCCAVVSILTSKSAMLIFPSPLLLCTTQFTFATIITSVLSYFATPSPGLVKPSLYSMSYMTVVTSVLYTFGFILTNAAFSLSNANSVETVKAAEPISSVILGQIFCPEFLSWSTYLSLLPIWLGVTLACVGDSAFSVAGSVFAMLSNFCFSGRAVAAKILYIENRPDEIVLFQQISLIGLALLVPLMVFMEGTSVYVKFYALPALTGVPISAPGPGNMLEFIKYVVINGFAYTLYNLASFMVLSRTNIVTHAVLNALRRVVIIIAAFLFFNVSISLMNILGILVALLGVSWFAMSKSLPTGGVSLKHVTHSILPQFTTKD